MADKYIKTVRLDDHRLEFLGRYGSDFSSQVREDLQLLEILLRAGEGEIAGLFTAGEACLLCDVLNGIFVDPAMLTSAKVILGAEVEDGIRLNDLDRKWELDAGELLGKRQGLTTLGATTVLHQSRLFWTDRGEPGDGTPRELVARFFAVAEYAPPLAVAHPPVPSPCLILTLCLTNETILSHSILVRHPSTRPDRQTSRETGQLGNSATWRRCS